MPAATIKCQTRGVCVSAIELKEEEEQRLNEKAEEREVTGNKGPAHMSRLSWQLVKPI